MKFVVVNDNLKTFVRAFHALAKLGDSFLFETHSDCVLLHSVNSSRSAYGSFRFSSDFFSSYIPGDAIKCKIALKSCFLAFKSVNSIEKHVQECVFEVKNTDNSLNVKFFAKHGIVKSFFWTFIDYEFLNMSFSKEKCKNRLTANSKLLADGIHNFLPTVEEVTLIVNNSKVILKNYLENEVDQSKEVHTELTLELNEFDNYVFDEAGEVTFCLKELKAILYFAEGSNLPISIHFSHSGDPIIFSINNNMGCETNFVFATLNDDASDSFQSVCTASDRQKTLIAKNQAATSRVMSASTMSVPKTLEALNNTEDEVHQHVMIDQINNQDDGLADEDVLPATPPKKRFKDVFLRYPKNYPLSMVPDNLEVLAPATDDSDDSDEY